jgi:uroporphyrin-3 C-methyltransferase/uroporphyrinogen III methyltransferase/synthase
VRAALARDIERLRVHPASDVGRIALRIDALLAALDPLPLISSVAERTVPGAMSRSLQPVGGAAPGAEAPAGGVQAGEPPAGPAGASIVDRLFAVLDGFGHELRQLFRVRQVDKPDAILVSPDQAYFLRQNLRLMLLNARLGLLSRNVPVYRADLERASRWIDTYYDGEHRNVIAVQNQLRQMLEAQLNLEPPRIDDSLAAVRTARAAVR